VNRAPSVPSGGGAGVQPQSLTPPETEGQSTIDIGHYANFVIQNLDQMWTQWFLSIGLQEPFVETALVDGANVTSYTSDCTNPDGSALVINSSFPNAFYCPLDGDGFTWMGTDQDQGAVIIPLDTMVMLWNTGQLGDYQAQVIGDFAAAYVIAHEFGHHVTDDWGRQWNALQGNAAWVYAPNTKWQELIADCFAGVWMYSVYDQDLLEPGDFEEALNLAVNIGDQGLSPNPHGTGPERYQAVMDGALAGDPQVCNEKYWFTDFSFDGDRDGRPDVYQPNPAGRPIPLD